MLSHTFIDEHEDLGQVEGSKVPAVQVEQHLQRSGRELMKRRSRRNNSRHKVT